MVMHGTIVNGVIVPDGAPTLPEGARVRFEVEPADPDDTGPPPEPTDRAAELAILRQSLEDAKAGRGLPLREAMALIAAEFGLPHPPE